MPFAATSYLLGLSTISMVDYMLGTCASLPALAGYVLIGTFLQQVGSAWSVGVDWLPLILLGVGVVATLALTVRLGQLSRKALALPEAAGNDMAA